MIKSLPIPFPRNGFSESSPYSEQPDQTTPNCLNVRVFDMISDRARGGQREGTSKYLSDPLESDEPKRIQNINSYVRMLDRRAIVAGKQRMKDEFTHDNDTVIDDPGYSEQWKEYYGWNNIADSLYPSALEAQASTNRYEVQSNKATINTSGFSASKNEAWGLLKTGTDHDYNVANSDGVSQYVVRVDLTPFEGEITDNAEYFAGIIFRAKAGVSDYFAAGWHRQAGSTNYKMSIIKSEGVGPSTIGPLADESTATLFTTTETTLELRVKRHYIEVYWGGLLKLKYDISGDGFKLDQYKRVGLCFWRRRDTGGVNWTSTDVPTFDNFTIYNGKKPSTRREEKLLAVSGGNVYTGDRTVGLTELTTGAVDAETEYVNSLYAFQKIFFIDGDVYKMYDITDGSFSAWICNKGMLPSDTDNTGTANGNGNGATLMALYNGRIVLSGVDDDPHNWFMSKIGNPLNFNYGGTGVNSAVSGNNAVFGKIGDPITALIPYFEQALIIGCDNSIWRIDGNPRDPSSGRISNVSEEVGVAGGNAWALGFDKSLYFFGTDGLYRITPNAFNIDQTQRASAWKIDFSFGKLDISENTIQLVYDVKWHGLHIFITPLDSNVTKHWFFDERTESFWPMQMPSDHGPTTAFMFKDDDPEKNALLLGGFDSYIRYFDSESKWDDGTAIYSHCVIGPMQLGYPDREWKLVETQCILDEFSDSMDYDVRFADTPQTAINSPASLEATFGAGRNRAVKNRARGFAGALVIGNAKEKETWALDMLSIKVTEGGRVRDRFDRSAGGGTAAGTGGTDGATTGVNYRPPPDDGGGKKDPPTDPDFKAYDIGDDEGRRRVGDDFSDSGGRRDGDIIGDDNGLPDIGNREVGDNVGLPEISDGSETELMRFPGLDSPGVASDTSGSELIAQTFA